ncbi:hypothetical protein K432DRAFT_328158 [Lepidopterella palustris CBS 459.81]|uniref:F-box domain-containing protein n=1 Tax=Lepidopterella palustris CBS 459.81 TaxID=1314670 RepID=A0A8E2JF93_9PEZI|nr:hypothetical protein K432DRAFT_328158 [Lepidopterella palustris CBS 459.81]
MESLPNELLIQIASFLDRDAPSVIKIFHEPSTDLTISEDQPLKALSRVSWRWRKIVIPILFRFARLELDRDPQWVPIDAKLLDNMQSNIGTLSTHEMQIYLSMRNKLKTSTFSAFDKDFDDLLVELCRIQDGDHFLRSAPFTQWLPHLPKTFDAFSQFVSDYGLKKHIQSLVVFTDKEYELQHVARADGSLYYAVSNLWNQIFSALDPPRFVVAAPPATLAGLLDSSMLSADVWAFEMKCHYLELCQPGSGEFRRHVEDCDRQHGHSLIHLRPWTHIRYNEGPSITAYSTYEFHLKQSPKILYLLLARLCKEAQDCCNIRSFSFIAVFPLSTNVVTTLRALQKVRTLRSVHFQLAPGEENKLIDEPWRVGRAQLSDLWLEWNGSYSAIARFLRLYEFQEEGEFMSSDCNLHYLADNVDEKLESLRESGIAWTKTGTGKWKRES